MQFLSVNILSFYSLIGIALAIMMVIISFLKGGKPIIPNFSRMKRPRQAPYTENIENSFESEVHGNANGLPYYQNNRNTQVQNKAARMNNNWRGGHQPYSRENYFSSGNSRQADGPLRQQNPPNINTRAYGNNTRGGNITSSGLYKFTPQERRQSGGFQNNQDQSNVQKPGNQMYR